MEDEIKKLKEEIEANNGIIKQLEEIIDEKNEEIEDYKEVLFKIRMLA
jgi:hypothetical protein